MAMPSSEFWGARLVEAVKNGSVAEARLDDMATRIVATFYQMRQVSDSASRSLPQWGTPFSMPGNSGT